MTTILKKSMPQIPSVLTAQTNCNTSDAHTVSLSNVIDDIQNLSFTPSTSTSSPSAMNAPHTQTGFNNAQSTLSLLPYIQPMTTSKFFSFDSQSGTLLQPITDAQFTRSLVLQSTVEDLESMGAGELSRMTKIINIDQNPILFHTVNRNRSVTYQSLAPATLKKMLIDQESHIESKLQKAFGRAFNSTTMHLGAQSMEKLLVNMNSTLNEELLLPLSACNAHNIAHHITNTNGQDLYNLTRQELSTIYRQVNNADPNLALTYHGSTALQHLNIFQHQFADDIIRVRTHKTRHLAIHTSKRIIRHKTSLFATLHKNLALAFDDYFFNSSPKQQHQVQHTHVKLKLSKIILQAAHNHASPQQVTDQVTKLLEHFIPSQEYKNIIFHTMRSNIAQFEPSDNLGLQMESPHARQLENEFAALVINRPTQAMQKIGKKMIAQLQSAPQHYAHLLHDYLEQKSHYIYPIAQNTIMTRHELQQHIESGTNLAITMDFNHFAIDGHMNAPFMQINSNEIQTMQNKKTYKSDIKAYRGECIPLPKLASIAGQQSTIGIGTNEQAVYLEKIKVTVDRPSTIKVSFGVHAQESAQADVAQACGTTGRGNIHLFGQAAINQWAPSNLRFSQEETQVYLMMLSAVMTADGGHTLSETLGTAYIASRNIKLMSQSAQALIQDMFKHMRTITTPMQSIQTRFNHFDMIFSSINDEDTHNQLTKAWNTVALGTQELTKGQ